MIPAAAVQTLDGKSVAFVKAERDRFEKRALKIGERAEGWIEVVDGLQPGETVVTEGSFLLKSEVKKGDLGGHHEE